MSRYNSYNDYSNIAFSAIDNGNFNEFEQIMEKYCIDVDIRNEIGQTLLTHSVNSSNDYYFIYYLFVHGINVNIQDKNGQTALMHAIMNNKPNIAIDILQFYDSCKDVDNCIRFDVNLQDDYGMSALMLACVCIRDDKPLKDLIKALFEQGAVNDLVSDLGKDAIDYAKTRSVRKLIERNGHSNWQNFRSRF